MRENKLNYLDIFAGAGGLSEGFTRVGFHPVAHVEMNSAACYTLKTREAYHWLKANNNLEIYQDYISGKLSRDEFYSQIPSSIIDSVIEKEISEESLPIIFEKIDNILRDQKIDVLVGGPPCQAYSLVGRARDSKKMMEDKRNYLYKYYIEFLKKYEPQYFVFENVIGLLSAKDPDGNNHLDNMISEFNLCGYSVEYHILNARDYGVLQNRKRIIIVGIKGKHTNFYPEIEKIDTSAYLVNDVLKDLPKIHSGEGRYGLLPVKKQKKGYLIESGIKEPDESFVTFHIARPNKETDLKIYKKAVNLWNANKERLQYTDLPKKWQSHKNKESFIDRFKIVAKDLSYSQTVVAHISKDGHYYIHPDLTQNRSLTPREAARLQTFPDNFYFESKSGVPSRTAAFLQIGNAVPVRLAEQIAKAIYKVICDE